MTSLVILEGKLDEIIVSRILDSDPQLRGRFLTAVAGGRSSAISLARSYLVTGDQRLALVLDADMTDLEKVAAEQALVADLLEGMAVPERFIVLMVVPEVEALLFFDRGFAETVFASQVLRIRNGRHCSCHGPKLRLQATDPWTADTDHQPFARGTAPR